MELPELKLEIQTSIEAVLACFKFKGEEDYLTASAFLEGLSEWIEELNRDHPSEYARAAMQHNNKAYEMCSVDNAEGVSQQLALLKRAVDAA